MYVHKNKYQRNNAWFIRVYRKPIIFFKISAKTAHDKKQYLCVCMYVYRFIQIYNYKQNDKQKKLLKKDENL